VLGLKANFNDPYFIGEGVEGEYKGKWYKAKIYAKQEDGTYGIRFDDDRCK
jgi:hypothetical protein